MKPILIIVLIGYTRLGLVSKVCTGEFQLSSSIPNHLVLMFVSYFFSSIMMIEKKKDSRFFFCLFCFSLCGVWVAPHRCKHSTLAYDCWIFSFWRNISRSEGDPSVCVCECVCNVYSGGSGRNVISSRLSFFRWNRRTCYVSSFFFLFFFLSCSYFSLSLFFFSLVLFLGNTCFTSLPESELFRSAWLSLRLMKFNVGFWIICRVLYIITIIIIISCLSPIPLLE